MTQAYDLELKSLVKDFGASRAVDHVDLRIRKGEFVSLLGPSGCGKSTTLMMIAGFEQPSAGEILVRGQQVQHLEPNERNVGIVFQAYALFPHMSVRQNVEYGLKMRKVAPADRARRVDEILKLVHMHQFAERSIRQLSGGQQQRVALARALVIEPDLLLLDEPFSALDRKLREEFQREVRLLQRKLGITTIFVTHDQEEALLMSDRIAVMSGGRIEQCAAPTTLYQQPATRFVASFIGRGSFIPGDAGHSFFRPEDAVSSLEHGGLNFDGTIQALYFKGSSTLADVKVDGHNDPLLIEVSSLHKGESLEIGAPVRFSVPAERVRSYSA
jgi:ABC-type Fe3+/spermidine/putrescine transport system ATPase subunit